MRINKYIASSTGLSRRAADTAIANGRVLINNQRPDTGTTVTDNDVVTLDGQLIKPQTIKTVLLNKPVSYVCSRDGQGSETVYDLLPETLHHLKPVGRLDKHSSGLLVMTNNGDLANELTHPSKGKIKLYQVRLNAPLQPLHRQMISDFGIQLEDGLSKLQLDRLKDNDIWWTVTMSEGRNRQIRRTFAALGYGVTRLHRIKFGTYELGGLKPGTYALLNDR